MICLYLIAVTFSLFNIFQTPFGSSQIYCFLQIRKYFTQFNIQLSNSKIVCGDHDVVIMYYYPEYH